MLSEKLFQELFINHAAIMLVVSPVDGRILFANLSAAKFYGCSVEELTARFIQDLNATSAADMDSLTRRAVREETGVFYLNHRLKNGEIRDVEVCSSLVEIEEGKYLFFVIDDITQQKSVDEELRYRRQALGIFQESLLNISSHRELSGLLNFIVERAVDLIGASSGGLYLAEPSQKQVRCVVSYKTRDDFCGTVLAYGEGAAGTVASTGEAIIIDDYALWSQRANVFEKDRPFQAVMSAPMLWRGEVIGVIHVLREGDLGKFTQKELKLLSIFADHASVAVENSRLFKQLDAELEERRLAEEMLDNAKSNLETFFNSIDEFLFVLDEKANMIHVNDVVLQRLGYERDELIGESVLKVHPPERHQEALDIVGAMLAGSADFCPVPLQTKSGQKIPVETRVTQGLWDGKQAIFGVTKDMSQLKFSEEKFSKAFHASPALMALSEYETGLYLDVNDVFLKTLEYERDEVIGVRSVDLNLFSNVSQRQALLEIMQRDGELKDFEMDVVTKNGGKRCGLFSAEKIYIGTELCLLTVMIDITDRRAIEEELQQAKENLEQANHKLAEAFAREQKHARIDALTQIYNNRYLFELATRELLVAKRYQSSLSMIIFDIDGFKDINDTYGHTIGDLALKMLAESIQKVNREADLFGRYGGDEFILVMPQTTLSEAGMVAKRMHTEVEKLVISAGDSSFQVQISIGVAAYSYVACPDTETVEEIFRRADEALYHAKKSGKNTTACHLNQDLGTVLLDEYIRTD